MAKKAKAMKKEKVDKGTYEAMKPYLTAALEYVIQTGQSVRAFFDFAVERFGGTVIPYVQRFMREVRDGTVKIAGLTKETRKKVLGEKFDPIDAGKKALVSVKTTAEKEIHVVKDVVGNWLSGRKEPAKKAAPKKKTAPKKKAAAKKKVSRKKAPAKKKAAPRKKAAAKKTAASAKNEAT